jgi:hypothetical protein
MLTEVYNKKTLEVFYLAAKNEKQMAMMGSYAFIAGFALAIIVGLAVAFNMLPGSILGASFVLLAIIGLVVSYLNITDKEMTPYLIAAIALLLSANSFTVIGGFMDTLFPAMNAKLFIDGFMSAVIAFVGPATLFTALKAIYQITKDV